MKKYAEEGKTFDVIINDLTAIPCTLDDELADDLWNFLKLILDLSMAVLSPTGHYFTQGKVTSGHSWCNFRLIKVMRKTALNH